jgi:hypothetical protein
MALAQAFFTKGTGGETLQLCSSTNFPFQCFFCQWIPFLGATTDGNGKLANCHLKFLALHFI